MAGDKCTWKNFVDNVDNSVYKSFLPKKCSFPMWKKIWVSSGKKCG